MKNKKKNSEMAEFPAIIIDEDHNIFFPAFEDEPRLGLMTFKRPPSFEQMCDILAKTGTKFGPTEISCARYTMVYFLGDLRTLKRKINGVAEPHAIFNRPFPQQTKIK